MVQYTPLVLSFTQAHLCDTPLCNASCDHCAIPHKKINKHERVLRYYRYKYRAIWRVSHDMKSIAAGPLRLAVVIAMAIIGHKLFSKRNGGNGGAWCESTSKGTSPAPTVFTHTHTQACIAWTLVRGGVSFLSHLSTLQKAEETPKPQNARSSGNLVTRIAAT